MKKKVKGKTFSVMQIHKRFVEEGKFNAHRKEEILHYRKMTLLPKTIKQAICILNQKTNVLEHFIATYEQKCFSMLQLSNAKNIIPLAIATHLLWIQLQNYKSFLSNFTLILNTNGKNECNNNVYICIMYNEIRSMYIDI